MVTVSPHQFYETLIANMPAGIERAMRRVLSYHVGKDNAISKPQLLADLKRLGFPTNERQARACIVDLRKAGDLICSSSGEGGYFVASTVEEYEEFAQIEYRAKIIDMSETLRGMDEGAQKFFRQPPEEAAVQSSLF